MGGRLFKETNIRLQASEYEQIIAEVKRLPDCYIAPSYRNKQSHGDVDVITSSRSYLQYVENKTIVNSYRNGSVNSFAIDASCWGLKQKGTVQLDFIEVEPEYLETAVFYFSYNDLNNLVGKIARQFNMRLGFKGLYYNYEKQGLRKQFLLSRNPQQIYDFLGCDWNRFNQGFDELEDIFQFVINSTYFSTTYFLLENLNHKHRKRDRVRSTYHYFLKYLKLHESKSGTSIPIISDSDIKETFDLSQIAEYETYLEKMRELRSHFNGYTVLEYLPEIDPTTISAFISFAQVYFISQWAQSVDQKEMKEQMEKAFELFLKHQQFS